MIKNIGTLNYNNFAINTFKIDICILVDEISDEDIRAKIDDFKKNYKEKHPRVINVAVDVILNVLFIRNFESSEGFFKIDNVHVRFYDQDSKFIKPEDACVEFIHMESFSHLPDEQEKELKKAIWDKLGEYMLNS